MVTNAEALEAKGEDIAGNFTAAKAGENFMDTSGMQSLSGLAGNAKGTFESGFKVVDDIAKGDMQALAGDAQTAISEANSFVTDGLSTLGEIVMDPLGWLISNGLEFLISWIQPLEDALELVTGDPEALTAGADSFSALAAQIEELRTQTEDLMSQGLAGWEGASAEAAGQRLGQFRDGMSGAAGAAGEIASLLSVSSMVMQVAKDILMGIISDFVEWLIITWVAALAAAGPTFGGSTAVAAEATAVNATVNTARATKHVGKVQKIIDKLKELIDKIKDFLKKAKDIAKKGVDNAKDAAKKGMDKAKELAKNPVKNAKEAAIDKGKQIKSDFKDLVDDAKDFKDAPLDTAKKRFQENFVNDNLGTDTADAIRKGEKTAGEAARETIRDGWQDQLKESAREQADEHLNPIAREDVDVRDEQTQQVQQDENGEDKTESKIDWGGTSENVGTIYDKIEDPVSRRNEHGDASMDSDEINRNLSF